MSYNAQIETLEIADSALDAVVGGVAGLTLEGQPGHLEGMGGAELAGHGVTANGGANLQSGQVHLNAVAG